MVALLTGACAGSFDLAEIPDFQGTGVASLSGARGDYDKVKKIEELREVCTRRVLEIRDKQARAASKTAKWKMSTGVIAGLLSTGGGVSSALNVESKPGLAKAGAWGTAAVAAAGTIGTILLDPGEAELEAENGRLEKIKKALEDFRKCDLPEDCAHAYGEAKGACTD